MGTRWLYGTDDGQTAGARYDCPISVPTVTACSLHQNNNTIKYGTKFHRISGT